MAKKAAPKKNPYTESMRGVPRDMVDKTVAQQTNARGRRFYTAKDNAGRNLQTGARVIGNPGKRSAIDVGPRKDYNQSAPARAPRKAPPKATRGKRG